MSLTTSFWGGGGPPAAVHLIRRPKLGNPFAWHYGVAVESAPGSGATVYDLVQGKGFGVGSLEEFLEGRNGEVLESLEGGADVGAAWGRLGQVLADPRLHRYHLTDRNCEHVARYIVNGERKSLQVQSGVFLGAIGLALLLARKAG